MAVRGEFAWFFKLTAPAEGIEKVREQFDAWLATVEFERDEQQEAEVPDWENPQGWFNTRGEGGQYAVVRIPSDPAPLSLSVMRLPVTTKESRYVTMNVNRWLRQLGLRPFEDRQVEELQQKRSLKVGTAKYFELSGRLQKPPAWRVAASRSRTMQSKEIRFDMPDGWEAGRMNAMRKLSLVKKSADEEDALPTAIVVTAFPASGMMGDTLANVKRWAGEAGIREDDEQLLKLATDRTIGGLDGQYVRLVAEQPDEEASEAEGETEQSKNQNAVIAAMVQRRGQMWFFKLNGPRQAVIDSEAEFEDFLNSFEFRESE
ncbi:MAG: hypothetical protein RH917_15445 [Lacipirellulaceae bacterium]